ncbi:hypothetical protein V6N12_069007 [Hibiscus sabdariffa]|uniref:DUF4283 domain-containing protein n=1 Tax=Hibiscus sabdariffa TaxID=183260 RepID=A0ABR2FCY8_9ROSI
MNNVDEDLAHISIGGGEDDGVQIELEDNESPMSLEYCFVGSFLTTSIINFPSMRSTMATVWHPPGSISIYDLGSGRFLFKLYHILDVERIESGGFMSKKVAKVLGNFIGSFLSYDSKASSLESVVKGVKGGLSGVVLDSSLVKDKLGPIDGFDVDIGFSVEESPLGNLETSKCPRVQQTNPEVSLFKDLTGANSLSLADLDNGASHSQ